MMTAARPDVLSRLGYTGLRAPSAAGYFLRSDAGPWSTFDSQLGLLERLALLTDR